MDVGIMAFYSVLRGYEMIVKEALQELCVGPKSRHGRLVYKEKSATDKRG